MRLPNGYGSVVKLGGKRRKPYAVRITAGRKKTEKGYIQTYKYLEYFENQKNAYAFLADYNAGKSVSEHQSFSDMPTFAEIYKSWLSFKCSLKKAPSTQTIRNYDIAYRRFSALHERKFATIRVLDIQPIASALSGKSGSTTGMAKTMLSQMYEYAIKNDYCDKNYAQLVTWEYTNPEEQMHVPFSDSEIKILWNRCEEPFVDIMLIMIYSGVRASELLAIENSKVNFNGQYFIGGMKTDAGTNRIIPIHDSVLPYYKRYYSKSNKYLITNSAGRKLSYPNFLANYWHPAMKRLGLSHVPHDTRHTFITLSDRCKMNDLCLKLIAGHAVNDITKGTYTHKEPKELLAEINKLPSKF